MSDRSIGYGPLATGYRPETESRATPSASRFESFIPVRAEPVEALWRSPFDRLRANGDKEVESVAVGMADTAAKVTKRSLFLLVAPLAMLAATLANADTYSLIVAGLGGETAYEQRFREQAAMLTDAAQKLTGDSSHTVALSGDSASRDSIRRELRALAAKLRSDDEVVITLIGHGSFDGDEYRFNIPGPDITAAELEELFDRLPAGKQLVVNATSASGAVAERWKRDNRIVVTATRSGAERNATRFPQYWVQALSSPDADVNRDEIVTATEAFEFASRKVADAFRSDVSLATEHARLEGSNAGSFQVARFGAAARVTADPRLNELFAQRARIERDLEGIKERKAALAENEYYDQLETVLVRLALLQRNIDGVSEVGRDDGQGAGPPR